MALHNKEAKAPDEKRTGATHDAMTPDVGKVVGDVWSDRPRSIQNAAPAGVDERGDRPTTLNYQPAASNSKTQPPASESVRTRDGYVVDKNTGRATNFAVSPEPYLQEQPRFGFTEFAERWNGRLAMIGFVGLVITEWIAGTSVVSLLTGGRF